MTPKAILKFVRAHYCDYSRPMVPLLLRHLEDDSHVGILYAAITAAIDRPMRVSRGMTAEREARLRAGVPDLASLGDTADQYTIVLNPDISAVTDWNFQAQLQHGVEVHCLRLWVNWFLPVYYRQTIFLRGWNGWVSETSGPLDQLATAEAATIRQVEDILAGQGFTQLDKKFVQQRDTRLLTDLSVGNASIFECLFSDHHYPLEIDDKGESSWRGGWD